MSNFDVLVVGSGPGGYVTAIRAAQLGLKTAIVERGALGGVCLNWGCIPTKSMLRSSEVLHLMKHASAFGIEAVDSKANLSSIVERSRNVAQKLSTGVAHLLKKNKVTVVSGSARLERRDERIRVVVTADDLETAVLSAKHIILAPGARARQLPALGLTSDSEAVWTYREALMPGNLPSELVVVGSGAIGIEFASFYNELGSRVTVIEQLDRILPTEDPEISKIAEKEFTRRGIRFMTGARVQKSEQVQNQRILTVLSKAGDVQRLPADRVLLAIGIVGNIEALGLEELGVKTDNSHIIVDAYGRTSVDGVYAIGDVTGPPWLAHKASHEGVACIEKIAGAGSAHGFTATNVPGCIYSSPQIASVGMTEERARAAGREVKVGRFPFFGNGKAIALGDDTGLVKTIFDATTGELIGAHMIGPEVTELVSAFALAIQGEMTEEEIMQTIFPHPTLSEALHESVLDAHGRVLHI